MVVSFHSANSSFGKSRLLPNSNLPFDFLLSHSLESGVKLMIFKVTFVLTKVTLQPALSDKGEHCCSLRVTPVPLAYSTLIAYFPLAIYLP